MKSALLTVTVLVGLLIASGTVLIIADHVIMGVVILAFCMLMALVISGMLASDQRVDKLERTAAVLPPPDIMKHG